MTTSGITRVRSTPICEVPAAALRIAAAFAATNTRGFDGVSIRPGVEEGEVLMLAASGAKAIAVTCIGSCQRALGLPTGALRAVLRRDPGAEQVAVVEAEAGVSVRTYSAAATVSSVMAEAKVAFEMPTPEAGPCEVGFARGLLNGVLKDLGPLQTIEIEQFRTGLSLSGQGDRFAVHALVAGWQEAPVEAGD